MYYIHTFEQLCVCMHACNTIQYIHYIIGSKLINSINRSRFNQEAVVFEELHKTSTSCKIIFACSYQIDLKPDPGFERWEEPYTISADASCGGGEEPWRRPGSCGPTGKCIYPDLSLQETLFHILVKGPHGEDWTKTKMDEGPI